MTATFAPTRPANTVEQPRKPSTPHLLLILVAPASEVRQCDAAIDNAVLAGAVTVTCEVDVADHMLTHSVSAVIRAIDDAATAHPGLPMVIVGHGDAAAVASVAADACGDDISGLVLTHPRGHLDPTSRAA